MAHEELYRSKSTWDGSWTPTFGPDRRDNRDPQQLGMKLLELRGQRFKKRPLHKIADWLEELS